MNYPSPRTPGHYPDNSYEYWDASPTPTPPYQPMATPRRTSTAWGHSRGASYSSPRPAKDSPRFNSQGYYATATDPRPSSTAPMFNADYRDAYHSVRSPTAIPTGRPPTAQQHRRQPSGPVPIRPGTAMPSNRSTRRPSVSQQQQSARPSAAPKRRQATDKDRRKYAIPEEYSVKNWDPDEVPILLLGSVFDAHSLGKWIYDWTVYRMGSNAPISDIAGELWLLLIKLYGKVKKAEETVGLVRLEQDEETLDMFINMGNRLQEKWTSLLKHCEKPMLSAAKKKDSSSLGHDSGIKFVETLFGREKRLEETEKFMQKLRDFNRRFEDACDDILAHPTR